MQKADTPMRVLSKIIFGGWWVVLPKYQEKAVSFIYKYTVYLNNTAAPAQLGKLARTRAAKIKA